MIVCEPGVDRAGRQIVLEGGDYNEYVSKPTVLWMHLENDILGYSLRERVDEGVLKSLILFGFEETDNGQAVYKLVKNGYVRVSSLCIKPVFVEQTEEVIVIQRWQLLEISICTFWITTGDSGEVFYNDLITKERIGKANGIWFAVFPNETGLEPPHFHVMEGKDTKLASVNIETGEIFVGLKNLNARQRALTHAFFEEKQNWARQRWNETRPG